MRDDEIVDRISSLSKNIVENILIFLPLRDAVRTSILCRHWRHSWSCIPHITFAWEDFPKRFSEMQQQYESRLMRTVDQVLLLHCGPILKFVLSVDVQLLTRIDRWILFLSRNGIQELSIAKWHGQVYTLPSSIFSCEAITYLHLIGCVIPNPPPCFKGFQKIRHLLLTRVGVISITGLDVLIRSCPSLYELVLEEVCGFKALNIYSSSLVKFTVKGVPIDLSFEHAPWLSSLTMGFHGVTADMYAANNGPVCELIDLLGSLLSITRLELAKQTFEIFAKRIVPEKLITVQLEHISAPINLNARHEMLAAFSLFRSCPFLATLKIQVCSSMIKGDETPAAEGFWDAFKSAFGCLKFIEVTDLKGKRSELMFLKFVLANAPLLRIMSLKLGSNAEGGYLILKQIIQFKRISAEAQIYIL